MTSFSLEKKHPSPEKEKQIHQKGIWIHHFSCYYPTIPTNLWMMW